MLSVNDNLYDDKFNVNSLCEYFHQRRKVILGDLISQIVLSHQKTLLLSDVGERFSRDRNQASFCCPQCQNMNFNRKGVRRRVFKSVLGRIHIPVVQVMCRHCRLRFCPYKELIGLTFTDRISSTLMDRQMSLTCKIPYRQARLFVESCLGVAVSPMRIRKQVDREAEAIRSQHLTAEGQVVYTDSTKVKAGEKERGESIHIAITAVPVARGNRFVAKKRLLFLKTGRAPKIKHSLKGLAARGIVHDGDMDLTGCAPFVQRCLWHLPHQLKHFLWLDGMSHEDKQPWIKRLINIVFGTRDTATLKVYYSRFMQDLRSMNCTNAYTHLKNAEKELTVSREQCFCYHTTAPIEREMREINRRADVGVRWSVKGVENLLLVKMFKRLNEP
jgi:hypothetical protein